MFLLFFVYLIGTKELFIINFEILVAKGVLTEIRSSRH